MQPFKALHLLAVAIFLLNALPTGALGAEPVTVAEGDGILVLQPAVPYDSAILAVTGAGRQVLRRVFESHEAIEFVPVDRSGQPLADGSYRWDLRLVGVAAVRPDGVAPTVVRRSGSFTIQGGLLTGAVARTAGGSEPDLTLASDSPSLVFSDTTASAQPFSLEVDADALTVVNQGVNDILTIESGVVGFFNAAPDPDVEIHVSDALPEIRLEGNTGSWDLRVSTNDFQIVDAAALPFPLTILEIEENADQYTLKFLGDGEFTGTVSDGSSRTLKRDLEIAPRDDLLEALRELPLYAWSYKKDAEGVRHVGPMAEDFHALFGLGESDQRISPADTSGLALIAIQALTDRLEQREREIADLYTRLERLESSR